MATGRHDAVHPACAGAFQLAIRGVPCQSHPTQGYIVWDSKHYLETRICCLFLFGFGIRDSEPSLCTCLLWGFPFLLLWVYRFKTEC